jgi:hypothetical protein
MLKRHVLEGQRHFGESHVCRVVNILSENFVRSKIFPVHLVTEICFPCREWNSDPSAIQSLALWLFWMRGSILAKVCHKKKLRGFGSLANYADRATAAS